MTKLEVFVLTVKDKKTGVRTGVLHVDSDDPEVARQVARDIEASPHVYVEINRVTFQMVKSEPVKR